MGISFRPAVRSGVKIMVGLAGPSGSGKTFSALEIAEGIRQVEGGDIFVIDTENRRAAHYADTFQFQHGELACPFTPEAYLEAIEAAVRAGAKVVVIDSMSHEHEGPGGILEIHEANVNRMAGENASYGKREAVKFSAWIDPKRRHNAFVNRLLQVDAHFVFCFRAKDKLKMVPVQKNGRTVNEPVSTGWQPIAADRFEYEMTALLVLPPNAQGRPDLSAEATKLPKPLLPMVENAQQITRQFGIRLAQWARGDEAKKTAGHSGQSRANPEESGADQPRIDRYHAALLGAGDRDELMARHDGFRDEWAGATAGEKDTAKALLKLHDDRIKGKLPRAEFDGAVATLMVPA